MVFIVIFFTPAETDGFSKTSERQQISSGISGFFLCILADFSNNVATMVSIILPIPSLSSLFFSGTWGLFQVLKLRLVSLSSLCSTFFQSSLANSRYLFSFSPSFTFTLWSAGTAKSVRKIIILFFWEHFTTTLADGFSLKFKWQQVSPKSRGLFLVFCSISTMLLFEWPFYFLD